MIVVGAGPVGVEMAQAFNRLGTNVIVITSADRVLPKDDRELTRILRDNLIEEGIKFLFSAGVTKVEAADGQIKATTSVGTQEYGDALLLATGRKFNVETLNLPAIGVSMTSTGVIVNRRCQTSVKNIYAAGDVTGRYNFTHMAEHMGRIAVFNALLHLPYAVDGALTLTLNLLTLALQKKC
jgi:pyruvate/2-oxoglutarate dehydrogenase complex dihydrolipoamide dehydrogenase (E3) component